MDTSTIIWIVVIVGAMIFNSVSKARKARQNGDNPPSQHGEAWPSIPWDEEESPVSPDLPSETPVPPRSTVRPEQATTRPFVRPEASPLEKATVRPQLQRSESGELPEIKPTLQKSEEQRTPAAKRERQIGDTHPQQPVSEPFPDECQSLEEIPLETSIPEYIELEAVDFADLHDPESDPAGRQPVDASIQARKGRKAQGESRARNQAESAGKDSEESLVRLVEEFDLRRAVIYSEILKPKFEED